MAKENQRVVRRVDRRDTRRARNRRYRLILNEAGGDVCNLLLKSGCHLKLKSGTDANPDVLKLKAQT